MKLIMCYIGFKLFKSLKYLQGNLLYVQTSTALASTRNIQTSQIWSTLSLIKMAAIGTLQNST